MEVEEFKLVKEEEEEVELVECGKPAELTNQGHLRVSL